MLKSKRIEQIEKYVFEHQTVSLDELVKEFNVSKNTIRRDVQQLVERGTIKKVYGGVAVNHTTLESFTVRQTRNQKQKKPLPKQPQNMLRTAILFILIREQQHWKWWNICKQNRLRSSQTIWTLS